MTHADIVAQAIQRAKRSQDADTKQRQREKDALAFQVPALQWPEDVKQARNGSTVNGVQANARPMLSIPKIDQPIQLILNAEKAAHLGIQVHPLSEDADDDTAEIQQGLYRAIERDSRAGLARSWAFDRAVKCGRGAYRVLTAYADDGGDPFDQKIIFQRILRQDDVFFDPSATEPDWSDGEWALQGTFLSADRYTREFGDSQLASMLDSFADLVVDEPDWFKEVDGKPAVRVMEYWTIDLTPRTRCAYYQGGKVTVGWKDELPKGFPEKDILHTRDEPTRKVTWYKLNAKEVLAEQEWDGKYIPLIPVIGRELQPFDGERRWTGVIENAMDGQRLFNYAASNAVEIAALEPKAPFMMVEGQDEGHEAEWDAINTRNLTRVHYRPINLAGQPAPPPARVQIDASRLGPSMMLLQEANAFIQSSTAMFDPSLGNAQKKDRSGRAILAQQEQGDRSSSDYLDNLAQVSMMYEAKVVLDLMGKVYDRPGRIARILGKNDDPKTVMLNAPFEMSPTGRPQPAVNGPGKRYDLTRGIYGVSVTVGKAYATRMEEASNEIGLILQADPSLMALIGPIYFKYRDFPGHDQIADVLKKVRAKQFPGIDETDDHADPQQLQAKLQAAEQQTHVLGEQLKQTVDYVKTEQAKHDAAIQIERLKQTAAVEIQRMKDATTLRVAEINALTKGVLLDQEQEHEALALGQTFAHEARSKAADRSAQWDTAEQAHEQAQQQAAQQAELGMVSADQGQAHALEQGEQGQAHALEQGQQAADLAPEPAAE